MDESATLHLNGETQTVASERAGIRAACTPSPGGAGVVGRCAGPHDRCRTEQLDAVTVRHILATTPGLRQERVWRDAETEKQHFARLRRQLIGWSPCTVGTPPWRRRDATASRRGESRTCWVNGHASIPLSAAATHATTTTLRSCSTCATTSSSRKVFTPACTETWPASIGGRATRWWSRSSGRGVPH